MWEQWFKGQRISHQKPRRPEDRSDVFKVLKIKDENRVVSKTEAECRRVTTHGFGSRRWERLERGGAQGQEETGMEIKTDWQPEGQTWECTSMHTRRHVHAGPGSSHGHRGQLGCETGLDISSFPHMSMTSHGLHCFCLLLSYLDITNSTFPLWPSGHIASFVP